VRWLTDRTLRGRASHKNLDASAFQAESDRSPGVLLASGYIAGGAIAGIVIAFMAGVLAELDTSLLTWAKAHNPFYQGANSDWLSLLPFGALCIWLYVTGRSAGAPLPKHKAS
jgi:hypothetical protein